MPTERKYKSFWSFYPYYLTEHSDASNRLLHFVGTGLIIAFLITGILLKNWWFIAAIPFCGYSFAWMGHFFIEKNQPATFTYPLYSLGSDFVMFWHILTGQINKKLTEANRIIHNDRP
ncbi:MAG: DUF962 domain-containing protein [Ferruginibacter sp.]